MSVKVYTGSSDRFSEWGLSSGFKSGLARLKPLNKLIEETLKDSTCKNLNDTGKEFVKKNLTNIHNLYNPANERIIKSYNAAIEALNILSTTTKDDPQRIEQLTKLNTNINWELCIDDTFVERLVLMSASAINDNMKIIGYFKKAYEEALLNSVKGETNGHYSAPASNCERTGICHCSRDNQPLKRGSCFMSGTVLLRSVMEDAAHDERMTNSMRSLFATSL
jgi:hypothetical protein